MTVDVSKLVLVLVSVVVKLDEVSVEVCATSVLAVSVLLVVEEGARDKYVDVERADEFESPHVATQYASPAIILGQVGASTAGFHVIKVSTEMPYRAATV